MYDTMNNCYFSRVTGFVIDGLRFATRDEGANYLIKRCFMSSLEADSFLNRMERGYNQAIKGV